jgi:dCMP deaminase
MSRRPSLDEYWLSMLPLVASRGTCPRRQVGAVLTDIDGRLVSTGYNGNAPGAPHCIDTPCPGSPLSCPPGLRDACEALHAEANALVQSRGSRRLPHTLYCGLTPCFPCAKLLLAEGVREVVAGALYAHDHSGPRLLNKHGVMVWVWRNGERTPWSAETGLA